MKKFGKWTLIGILFLGAVYAMGPKPDFPSYTLDPARLSVPLHDLDEYIKNKEAQISDIKTDNQSQIIWYNDSIAKSEFSIVYLHGFSASHGEGDPVHKTIAERYRANLYLPRLYDHGRDDDDTFKGMTPKDLVESAKEAIAIGSLIGEKVIVMSCSTGGTLSIMLASEDPRIHSLIMYSPNIGIKDPTAALITFPWGEHIMNSVMGGKYNKIQYTKEQQQYWNSVYHTDGLIALQALIDEGMTDHMFSEINIPVYIGCYYKNETNQDNVVSVARMEEFFGKISTPTAQKKMTKFPNAGRHVFTSSAMVADFDEVLSDTYSFIENTLGLIPQ